VPGGINASGWTSEDSRSSSNEDGVPVGMFTGSTPGSGRDSGWDRRMVTRARAASASAVGALDGIAAARRGEHERQGPDRASHARQRIGAT
jgi:hypothetical protein